jgi:hypothetical protein
VAQATITFEGTSAESSNGHGAVATDAQLVFELAALATDEAWQAGLERFGGAGFSTRTGRTRPRSAPRWWRVGAAAGARCGSSRSQAI